MWWTFTQYTSFKRFHVYDLDGFSKFHIGYTHLLQYVYACIEAHTCMKSSQYIYEPNTLKNI